nr:transposase, MuDR [Tanacetum cinerariifolium]
MLLCEWMLRPDGHPFDPYVVYKTHHGKVFTNAPNRVYNGGKVNWIDQIDSDGFSIVEVTSMLAGLGYVNLTMQHWYKFPNCNLDNGLLPLTNDSDVLKFINSDPSEPNAIEMPNVSEQSQMPNVSKPNASEMPNVGEHNLMPKVGEHSKMPNVDEQSKVPSISEQSDGSEESEDNKDNDFDFDIKDKIDDVDVDNDAFRKHINDNVE